MWICDHFSTSINVTQIWFYTIYLYSPGGSTALLSDYGAAVSETISE